MEKSNACNDSAKNTAPSGGNTAMQVEYIIVFREEKRFAMIPEFDEEGYLPPGVHGQT